MTAREFARWVKQYDGSGIGAAEPPATTRRHLANVTSVLCSHLPRAVETARRLAPGAELVCDPLFREVELPVPGRAPGWLRLPSGLWSVGLRLWWLLLGALRHPTARAHSDRLRERVEAAARLLIRHARDCGAVALVGHGVFNLLLARELRARGWNGPRLPSARYWGVTAYRYRA